MTVYFPLQQDREVISRSRDIIQRSLRLLNESASIMHTFPLRNAGHGVPFETTGGSDHEDG